MSRASVTAAWLNRGDSMNFALRVRPRLIARPASAPLALAAPSASSAAATSSDQDDRPTRSAIGMRPLDRTVRPLRFNGSGCRLYSRPARSADSRSSHLLDRREQPWPPGLRHEGPGLAGLGRHAADRRRRRSRDRPGGGRSAPCSRAPRQRSGRSLYCNRPSSQASRRSPFASSTCSTRLTTPWLSFSASSSRNRTASPASRCGAARRGRRAPGLLDMLQDTLEGLVIAAGNGGGAVARAAAAQSAAEPPPVPPPPEPP